MPGIFGLIGKMPRERAERELQKMIAVLRHESFYNTGVWIDETIGVYVGWVTRKGSFSDRMPLSNESKDTVLIFSGEEFSDPDRIQSIKRQVGSHSQGPSYLLALYEKDPDFFANLNGWFQGLA